MNLINRHAHYVTMMKVLNRPAKPYTEWLETILVSTEQLLVIERETNERLSELLLDATRDNARLEAELANTVAMPDGAWAESEGAR